MWLYAFFIFPFLKINSLPFFLLSIPTIVPSPGILSLIMSFSPNPTSSRFHIFNCPIWLKHAWRTTLFDPPKLNSLVTAEYILRQLHQSLEYQALTATERLLLDRLAEQIDNLILYIAKRPLTQRVLNISQTKFDELGAERTIVVGGFITCILLDRFCWVRRIGIPQQYSQKQFRFESTSTFRDYKRQSKTLNTLFSTLDIKDNIDSALEYREKLIVNALQAHSVALGTYFTAHADISVIMANCCFAACACLFLLFVSHRPFVLLYWLLTECCFVKGFCHWRWVLESTLGQVRVPWHQVIPFEAWKDV